jgi:EAL domain-containing protein (putative c-di-GMP-specific phosphodiesterase class I)
LAVYDPSMAAATVDRVTLEAELVDGLTNGEVRLLYEPIVRLADGGIAAYEARVVWEHPHRGSVAPPALAAIADAIGMTIPLYQWTLAEACRHLGVQRESVAGEVAPIGFDIAPRPFRHPALVGDVARALHGAGASPHHLRLEIDQAQVLDDIATTVARLAELEGIGVTVAIDGFGTGYAALGFLQRYPVDCLKIGGTFVAGLGVNADDSAIVQAALAFARGLEIPVVAVGVETAAQLDELRRLGCVYGQGGLFGPPVTADELGAGQRPAVEAGAAQRGDDSPRTDSDPVASSGAD